MVRGPLALLIEPNPQANGPGQLELLGSGRVNGEFNCGPKPPGPPGCCRMWRLKMLKNSARKSIVARSPTMFVFLPSVKFSFRPPKVRALARVLGSFPKVNGAGAANALALKKGVVNGSRSPRLVCFTPGITFTRALPVK